MTKPKISSTADVGPKASAAASLPSEHKSEEIESDVAVVRPKESVSDDEAIIPFG